MSKRVAKMGVEVPLWLVASIGKKVVLQEEFSDGVRTYPAGSEGVLMSLRGDLLPRLEVDVCLNPNDPTDWERFALEQIRPASQEVTFSLELERGVMIF